MEWETLLSTKRARGSYGSVKKTADLRSEFEKIITGLSGALPFGGCRIRHRYFHWTRVISSGRDSHIRWRFPHLESHWGRILGKTF
mgnify:CR=1 FL=1